MLWMRRSDKAANDKTNDARISEAETRRKEERARKDTIRNDRNAIRNEKADLKNKAKKTNNDLRAGGKPTHGISFMFFKRKAPEERPRDERGRFMAKQTSLDDLPSGKTGKRPFLDGAVIEYKTRTVKVNNVKYKIPVDENGKVPKSAITARLLDVTEGTGRSNKRNVVLDHQIDADVILPQDITPEEIAEWWHAPNTRDVKGIDTKDASVFELKGHLSKGAKEAQGKIAVDGTPEQIMKVREMITSSFTVAEQKALVKKGGISIQVDDNMSHRHAALYRGKRDGMSYQIFVHPDHIDDGSSILHELIHHSRMVDETRDHVLIKSRSKSDQLIVLEEEKDRTLEEATTVLETLTRQNDYRNPKDPSYHAIVAKGDRKKAMKMIKEDRELVAGSAEPGSKGLRGKRARKAVVDNFEESNISELVLPKNPMASKLILPDDPTISAIERLKELLGKRKK